MKITTLLHFYQPINQQEDILNRVVNESYRPITEGLLKNPKRKIVANVTGALFTLLHEKGYEDVLSNFKELINRNQIELTASSMYHAFLPLIPQTELRRQVMLNNHCLNEYISNEYNPHGFFSPEMAISTDVLTTISDEHYVWIAVPEVAAKNNPLKPNKLYKDKKTGIYTMFRNKRISSLILASTIKTSDELIKETMDVHDDAYWFVVMDAETFGHHRIGHEQLLFDILDNSFFEPSTVKDLLDSDMSIESVDIRSCTWTNEEQDFWVDKDMEKETEARSFILWKDPTNPIHTLQWELTYHVINVVNNYSNKNSDSWKNARIRLDMSIASDQYWWASAKPWWSLEMIEQGAFSLKSVIQTLDNVKAEDLEKSDSLYRKILDKAFEWQRTGYIRKRHLENSSTYMTKALKKRTHNEWYNQIILELEDQMNKAANNRNYEQAIKWRDAIYKLKLGTDMYDVLHVVDELWTVRTLPSLKPFFEYDFTEFTEFAKDNFLGFNTKEEFEEWKKTKKQKNLSE